MIRSYGERVKEIREKYSIDQTELAKRLNVHQPSLSALEKNTYPSLKRIEEICKVLGIELWQFFLDDESKSNNLKPSWLSGNLEEALRLLFTDVSAEEREAILHVFYGSLRLWAITAGYNLNNFPDVVQ